MVLLDKIVKCNKIISYQNSEHGNFELNHQLEKDQIREGMLG